ncbi:dihydrofolate reductase [Ilyomonas limi]|uniref:Dihydrofolate reductase n=1 Tax=Ilyomonas limi TaxID=2575867 RepID=A0A4U3L7R9_9BACT|nr:dihydrofolate reductase [Ilyomonas limi]TKK69896.1 dihydrofolate reductase [Ilyomonas limi]
MNFSFVVAAAENDAIGKDNAMLWHLPNDLKFFKNITWAMPVLMGRKTFEALGSKPLNGRANIILTHKKDYKPGGAVVVNNIADAIFFAEQNDYKETMVIGGGEIYKELLPKATKIYLTRVHTSFPEADAFFPSIDETKWVRTSKQDFDADDKHAYSYSFELWERK